MKNLSPFNIPPPIKSFHVVHEKKFDVIVKHSLVVILANEN